MLGHLLLFLSLVLPFTKLQNNSPAYLQTSCLLFTEVDKGTKTSLKRTDVHWHLHKLRQLRNKVTKLIRDSKTMCNERTANKLRSETLSSKDWWTTLKSVISPNSKCSVPPLQTNGMTVSDELEKAYVLNNFF